MGVCKEKVSMYLCLHDMEEKLKLGQNIEVSMAEKKDGHYVAVYNDGQPCPMIRLRSSKGNLLKYSLGPEVIPNLPEGVELRAELVLEKQTAKSSYQQFRDTNAMFASAYLDEQAPNPFLELREFPEWDGCDENGVPCRIALHVHGLVDHRHDLNTALVAQYLEDASAVLRQIEWTRVTSVRQAQERLQAEFDAHHEGVMFFVQEFGPAPRAGNAKADADSRSCSPEPLVLINSKWIKGKLRESFTGTVVRVAQDGTVWVPRVRLHDYPLDIPEVKVRLGNIRGFHEHARVNVDVVPNYSADRTPRHVIGMGAVGAAGACAKRKRD